jgi:hypothetical protein
LATRRIKVAIETGPKRVFATAVDWPGLSRRGRDEPEALEALLAAAPRYIAVVKRAKVTFERPTDVEAFEVVERVRGGSGTDFGVPSSPLEDNDDPMTAGELKRQSALLRAAWHAFDASAHKAVGKRLRKGPRGGGRDLAKMTGHVLEAEEAYLHQLGRRRPKGGPTDVASRMNLVRSLAMETLATLVKGEPIDEPNKVLRPWSPRYFLRRSAWHALDHAWEIEDRVT